MTSALADALIQKQTQDNQIVDVDEPSVQLVIVEMAGEQFALYGYQIKEILAQTPIYFVPGCTQVIEGVINVRGSIESVINLNLLLQLDNDTQEAANHILLSSTPALTTGIKVTQVLDMLDTVASNLQPAPSTTPAHLVNFVSKVLEYHGKPVAILDLDKIFTDYVEKLG